MFLPKTTFAMKAGLPQREPELLKRWEEIDLYNTLRKQSAGRPKYVLHDGPPYANGHLHIGHALNKILKDIVTRSRQMQGFDSNYVPGWDCHGLPIEWKIEEQYREKGRNKDEVPINDFRKECRAFAAHWIDVQREEFKRLGVTGDWDNPYLTMDFRAEALIANELLKFAESGQLYRGSKPVMWSVVEKTALAEAEVEYQDYQSDTIWVKFPVRDGASQACLNASVVIWTTTPWTIPGNRAISFSSKISYGLYEVTAAPEGNWAKAGDKLILADRLAEEVMKSAKVESFCAPRRCRSRRPHLRPSAGASGLCLRRAAARRRPRDGRYRHRLRPHRSRPWRGRLQDLDGKRGLSEGQGHCHHHPLHGGCRRLLHQGCAGLHGKARHHRQGREG